VILFAQLTFLLVVVSVWRAGLGWPWAYDRSGHCSISTFWRLFGSVRRPLSLTEASQVASCQVSE